MRGKSLLISPEDLVLVSVILLYSWGFVEIVHFYVAVLASCAAQLKTLAKSSYRQFSCVVYQVLQVSRAT